MLRFTLPWVAHVFVLFINNTVYLNSFSIRFLFLLFLLLLLLIFSYSGFFYDRSWEGWQFDWIRGVQYYYIFVLLTIHNKFTTRYTRGARFRIHGVMAGSLTRTRAPNLYSTPVHIFLLGKTSISNQMSREKKRYFAIAEPTPNIRIK